jgi:hypothetical protein
MLNGAVKRLKPDELRLCHAIIDGWIDIPSRETCQLILAVAGGARDDWRSEYGRAFDANPVRALGIGALWLFFLDN